MVRRNVRPRLIVTALTGGCIALSLALAPIANADETDQFAAALAANGIPAVSGLPDLVKTGHQVCSEASPDQAVADFEEFANRVTPGQDPARVHRTALAFVRAAEQTFCPGFGPVASHVKARIILAGANGTAPAPLPSVPDVQQMLPHPQEIAPKPEPKAPPVVGPPPGAGGGGGGTGGGTGGGCHQLCGGPGIVSLAP